MKLVFGFSRPIKVNILSKIIELVLKRPFSHSYVRFETPLTHISLVFQASGLVVNIIQLSNFCLKEIIVEEYEHELSDDDFKKAVEYMLRQTGTNYGVLQLFLDLFYIVFRVKLPFKSTGEVCSEQSARVAQLIGLNISGDLSYYTPSDFQKFCAANMKLISA